MSESPLSEVFRLAYIILGVFVVIAALFVFTQPREALAQRMDERKRDLKEILGPVLQGLEWSLYIVVALIALGEALSLFGGLLGWPRLTDAGEKCLFLGIFVVPVCVLTIVGQRVQEHYEKKEQARHNRPTFMNQINNSGNQIIGAYLNGEIQQHAAGNSLTVPPNLVPEQLAELGADLTKLRTELLSMAQIPEHYVSIGEISAAEQAAANRDETGVKSHLLKAGQWAFDVATKIGTAVLAEYLKRITRPDGAD